MRSFIEDRTHAGRVLAGLLRPYADQPEVLVLVLPRGGVPVAHEVAQVAVRQRQAARVAVAVPTVAHETAMELRPEVDDWVAALEPTFRLRQATQTRPRTRHRWQVPQGCTGTPTGFLKVMHD